MPLGAVITAANVNDSTQTQTVLESLVVKPPAAATSVKQPDPRDLAAHAGRWGLWQPPQQGAGGSRGLSDGGS